MRSIVLTSAVVLAATGLAVQPAVAAEHSVTFAYTGDVQYFEVPAGVTSIDVEACGAQGERYNPGGPIRSYFGFAGLGGRALSTITVTAGQQLAIHVGGSGASGGWNGGGGGFSRGGGASDVRQGGTTLSDRVVVGGGGGGNGALYLSPQGFRIDGGEGGGLTGGGSSPGTQTGPGIDPIEPELNGALGVGGSAPGGFPGPGEAPYLFGGGGGGGLYGGAAGSSTAALPAFELHAGSGGSGLGDSFEPGVCEGDGYVTLSFGDPGASIRPSGAAMLEGDSGSSVWRIPVRLSEPSDEVVTVEWATGVLAPGVGVAEAGSDFVAASGKVTFEPGDIEEFVEVEILGDIDDEEPLLWGEWGVVEFANPANATIDTGPFFGLGLFIIFDDD